MNRELGYYTCDGVEFESKLHALQHASRTGTQCQWHFNTWEFAQQHWDQEPLETLDQLYQRRARQIREQYDYVIVSFSGGSDSWNLMKAFMDQGLLVDEVVSNWALDASERFVVLDTTQRASWNNPAEYRLNCVERLKEIQARCPSTKITINDTSQAIVDAFVTADDASWTENKREVLNPNGTVNYNYKYFKKIRQQFDRDKKIAIVLGQDKPKLQLRDNKLYLFFSDKTTNLTSVQEHLTDYPNCHTVFFYWSPDCGDLLAKQGHTVLKLLRHYPKWQPIFATKDVKVQRQMQEPLLRQWLYSSWDPSWFQVQKGMGDWISNLDTWFIEGWAGTRAHAVWAAGLEHVKSTINEKFLVRNEKGTTTGLVPFSSPSYCIGSL